MSGDEGHGQGALGRIEQLLDELLDAVGPDDSGPIVLPDGANCASCAYSRLIPKLDQKTGAVQFGENERICTRRPPTMVFRFLNPQAAAYGPTFPTVTDEIVCFEYDDREDPEVLPTALSFGAENGD